MGRVRFRFQVQEFRVYKDLVSYVTPDWSFSSGDHVQLSNPPFLSPGMDHIDHVDPNPAFSVT